MLLRGLPSTDGLFCGVQFILQCDDTSLSDGQLDCPTVVDGAHQI